MNKLSFFSSRKRLPFLTVFLSGLFIVLSLSLGIYFGFRDNKKLVEVFEPKKTSVTPFPLPPTPTIAPYPVNISGVYPSDTVTASGIVIVDVDSGVYLYRKNDDMKLLPASTTKILTALVALDAFKLDDVVVVGKPLLNGQSIGLTAGEQITVENLLYGALIHSGNDAAYALAEHYPGGVEAFVSKMNEKAIDLHMMESHFANPMGYDDPNQFVTAMDLSRLAVSALHNPVIVKMVAIPQITISDITHSQYHRLTNVNQLLGKIPGVAGIKTGWTEEAGENLVTYVDRDGKKVVLVVLHSRDRFGDTTKLIDWVYGNFEWQAVLEK